MLGSENLPRASEGYRLLRLPPSWSINREDRWRHSGDDHRVHAIHECRGLGRRGGDGEAKCGREEGSHQYG